MQKFLLEITVFVCGALVMIYEITGARLLAPYIGTSLYVWTSIIGVILAALSLGYWLGGLAADKKPDIKILASIIFLAGGAIAVTIFFKDIILAFVSQIPINLEIKSIIAALILFAPASVLLGFVTPYAVKLKLSTLEETGKTVGRLYALSTVGSIFGTFYAGFFLIPFVGSTRTLYIIGATLFALSLLLAPFSLTRKNLIFLTLFLSGIGINEAKSYYLYQHNKYEEIDTSYSNARTFIGKEPGTNREIRYLMIDPNFVQSAMYLDNGKPATKYIKFYHLLRHYKPDFQKTLIIGGAGYSFPREYLEKYPTKEIDVVEIDSQMTEIAREYFRLKDNPRMKIFHEDGRTFLNRAEPNQYDAILVDAFGSQFNIPFQLTTIEAVAEIKRLLKPNGVVIFNVGSAITGDASGFLQAELKTYREVFPQVFLYKVDADKHDAQLQNVIITAVNGTNQISRISYDAEIRELLEKKYTIEISTEKNILTDDLAPVEYYNSEAQSH